VREQGELTGVAESADGNLGRKPGRERELRRETLARPDDEVERRANDFDQRVGCAGKILRRRK
jgi:hypothetical protein